MKQIIDADKLLRAIEKLKQQEEHMGLFNNVIDYTELIKLINELQTVYVERNY